MGELVTWSVLTIGNISRNRFWGEGDDKAMRPVLCTSTLIRADGKVLLADPSEEPEAMEATLFRRTGLHLKDIDAVFITHHHGDHAMGISGLSHAKLYVPAGEPELVKLPGAIAVSDADEIIPGVKAIALPGHTMGLLGLLFRAAEGMIAVVGDAVMTRDFFTARVGYFNSVDFAACTSSHEKLASLADIIVPGHDNFFLVSATAKDLKNS